MASAGYGLPDAPGWWARNIGTIDKNDVTQALGSLGGASKGAQGNKQQPLAPSMPGAMAGAGSKQGAASLAPLLQLLMQNRNALLQSATAGPGGQARPQGLLGV